jgi:hypothetical protein
MCHTPQAIIIFNTQSFNILVPLPVYVLTTGTCVQTDNNSLVKIKSLIALTPFLTCDARKGGVFKYLILIRLLQLVLGDRRGCDHMVVGFTTS